MVKRVYALIIDDEINACKNIDALLQQHWGDTIEIIGMASSTEQAEQIMSQVLPDVLFIDIEMPNENAFQFLTRLGNIPFEIIFVTAYDEYALRALKLNALDYILKPISIDELNLAIEKLIDKLSQKQTDNRRLSQFLDQISKKASNNSIILRSKYELIVVEFNRILYVEAEGSYARFHFQDSLTKHSVLLSHPLSYYEELLPTNLFYRIHKSYLVNYTNIKKVIRDGSSHVVLKDAATLPLSRRKCQNLLDFLNNKNTSLNGQ